MIWLVLFVVVFLSAPILLNGAAYLELARVRRDDPDCEETPQGAAAVYAFLGECAATATFLLASLRPRRAEAGPEITERSGRGRIVVLVPDRGLLARTHSLVQSRLAAAGETVIPCPVASSHGLEAAADALAACLANLPPGSEEIVLLGIGTGGLVARYHLRRRAAPRVRRLFTIGCPHFGTASRVACRLGWKEAGAGEPLMRQLTALDRIPDQFAVTSIAADFDAWILPLRNRDYPGAFNIQIRGYGHLSLLASRRVVELLVENLDA